MTGFYVLIIDPVLVWMIVANLYIIRLLNTTEILIHSSSFSLSFVSDLGYLVSSGTVRTAYDPVEKYLIFCLIITCTQKSEKFKYKISHVPAKIDGRHGGEDAIDIET